jgi:hypothetical protein
VGAIAGAAAILLFPQIRNPLMSLEAQQNVRRLRTGDLNGYLLDTLYEHSLT